MATHSSILPGEPQEQKSLPGYSPWGHKESDKTQQLSTVYYSSLFVPFSSRSLVSISYIFSNAFLRFWIIFTITILNSFFFFLEGCLSPLHLVIFIRFYLVPSSET